MLTELLSGPDAAPALILGDSGEVISYATLREAVATRAEKLTSLRGGLAFLGVNAEFGSIVDYLALVSVGATVLLLDSRTSAARCTTLVEAYRPRLVSGLDELAEVHELAVTQSPREPLEERVLLGTSGSTGSPKYVRLSEANLLASAEQIVVSSGLRSDDRGLLSLPLYYSFGLSVLHSHLLVGASLVLSDISWTSPDFGDVAARAGVTGLFAVPYSMVILRRTGLLDRGIAGLRRVTVAGGRLGIDETLFAHERLREKGTDLVIRYGATEASAAISVLPSAELPAQVGSAGYPMPGLRVSIEPCVDGSGGVLAVEGPSIMLGYAHGREDLGTGNSTGNRFVTGDIASIDDSGRIWINGRQGNFAKVRGLRINLDDVESQLDRWGLGGCAVVLESNEHIMVVAEPSGVAVPQAREVERVAGLPPRSLQILTIDELPRTPVGKIDRAAIREMLAEKRPALDFVRTSDTDGRKNPHE